MDKQKLKSIRGLILFTAAVILCILYSREVLHIIVLLMSFLRPFIIGGAIAFVINLLMKKVEKLLFSRAKGKAALKIKRPASILLSVLLLGLVITLVCVTVIPQILRTLSEIGAQIPIFTKNSIAWLETQLAAYPDVLKYLEGLETIEFDWNTVISAIAEFLKSGFLSVITSTVSVASSIVGGVINAVVSVIFAFYILSQKEKLENQTDRVLSAYLKESVYLNVKKVAGMLYKNFSSFISGQCLEAVILGCMFIVVMPICGLPYAVLIGVLVAFTALIPIVGAFIGCAVGVFLILIEDPVKAFWFLILFLVIQQIEGNLIYPHVVGNSVGLPSIWVLVAVSVGGSMMGILGMLLFIPLAATIYALVREDVNRRNGKGGAKRKVPKNLK